MTEMIGEKLNNEYLYQSFIIYFAFVESNCSFHNCDGLKKYLTKTLNYSNQNSYIMTGNKNTDRMAASTRSNMRLRSVMMDPSPFSIPRSFR